MRNWRSLIVMFSLLSVLAAACGGGAEDAVDEAGSEAEDAAGTVETEVEGEASEMTSEMESEGMASEMTSEEAPSEVAGGEDVALEDLTGEVIVSGSSTVQPISALNGELFAEQAPGVTVSVDGPGTGDGFELFCEGSTDISDASRPIEEEEIAACEEAGIDFIELQVAIDGITMLTNPANTAVTCLDVPAIYALVGPESEGFANWTEAQPLAEELGSAFAGEFPDATLDITAPGQESGTYDSFVELTYEDLLEERGQEDVLTRPDYNASADDNVIIQGITGSESSFGWVGYSFFEENSDSVAALEFQGEDGECVAPTPETIADGSYGLARPLFIYVSAQAAEEKPEVAAYVDYYLSEEGLLSVTETGYIDSPEDVLSETQSRWESRETGAAGAEEASSEASSEAASEASSEAASEEAASEASESSS